LLALVEPVIDHLMNAVKDLNKLYSLQKWLMIVAIVLAVLGVIAMAASSGAAG
jgi:predicted ferric reductase